VENYCDINTTRYDANIAIFDTIRYIVPTLVSNDYYHCIINDCTVLYCTVLYCTVLYCTVLPVDESTAT